MVLTGRGGYGNYIRNKKDANSIPCTYAPIQHFSSPTQTFRAGRGGYGNNLPISKMPTLTPDQYLLEVHKALDVEPTRYSFGRGGSGNIVCRDRVKSTKAVSGTENILTTSKSAMPKLQQTKTNDADGPWHKLRVTVSN